MKKTLGNISDQHRAEQKWQKEADGPLPAKKRRMYGRLYGIILLLALAIARRFCLKNSGVFLVFRCGECNLIQQRRGVLYRKNFLGNALLWQVMCRAAQTKNDGWEQNELQVITARAHKIFS